MNINKTNQIDDDIDRGREMDDDGVRDWEKKLIKGSAIPGPNPEENGLYNCNADVRPIDVRIKEKLTDVNERLHECQNNQQRISDELDNKNEM